MQRHEEEYTYHFTVQDVAELEAAVSKVKAAGVSTEAGILKVPWCLEHSIHPAYCA